MVIKNYKRDYDAYQKVINGKSLSLTDFLYFASKLPFNLMEGILRNIPGPLGYKLRYYFYKPFMKHLGKGVMIDIGVKLGGLRNLSISDYSWIDSYCIITSFLDDIEIGKRVHVAPFSIIHANKKITIGDYAGISSGVKVFSSTSIPNNKRISGPTIPREMASLRTGPITIGKDSVIYTNTLVLPGTNIGEGAIVHANSIIFGKVKPYDIVSGHNKVVGKRKKVTVKDI